MIITVGSYTTGHYGNATGYRRPLPRDRWHWSGISGGGPESDLRAFKRALERDGHATTDNGRRPTNHYIASIGVGHQDATFAETGASMAAYYENVNAPRWFEPTALPHVRRQYRVQAVVVREAT